MTQEGGRGDAVVAGGLLAVALLFGGGSALFPFYRLIVELVAVVALGWFAAGSWRMPQGLSARVLTGLVAAVLLLLIAQLVPLPPGLWQALPGRDLATAVYTAVGEAERWAPASLDPASTRDTIAFFLVPVAMFVAAMRTGRAGQLRLLQVIAVGGLLNGLLVAIQFQGFAWLSFYMAGGMPGTGLFSNKNHSAMFLVAAMPAAALSIVEGWRSAPRVTRRWIATAATGFLALAVFGCLSRAGIALLPIGLVTSAAILAPRDLDRRRLAIVLGAIGVTGLLLAVVLPQAAVVGRAIARFEMSADLRYQFWPVVTDAIGEYLPAGSGFGSFRQVFAGVEPLAIIQPSYINHAHSDYLEIALEGGVAGIVLVVGFMAWFALTAFSRLRSCWWGRAGFPPLAVAVSGLAGLLLHSILDYPLRTLALAAVAAVYCAILATVPTALDLRQPRRYRTAGLRRAEVRA